MRRLCPTAVHEGIQADVRFIQLESEPTSQSLDRCGPAIIGAVLVWAALARPSSSDAALAPAPNDHSMPSISPSAPKPTQNDLQQERIRPPSRPDHGAGFAGSDPVAISIPKIGVRSRLVDLGRDADGAMEVPQDPARAGWSSGGPHQVHSGRPSSPGT